MQNVDLSSLPPELQQITTQKIVNIYFGQKEKDIEEIVDACEKASEQDFKNLLLKHKPSTAAWELAEILSNAKPEVFTLQQNDRFTHVVYRGGKLIVTLSHSTESILT